MGESMEQTFDDLYKEQQRTWIVWLSIFDIS